MASTGTLFKFRPAMHKYWIPSGKLYPGNIQGVHPGNRREKCCVPRLFDLEHIRFVASVRKISFQTVKTAGEFRALSSFLSEIGGGASAAIDRIPSMVRGIYSDWILRIMADLAKLRCSIRSSTDYLNDIDVLD